MDKNKSRISIVLLALMILSTTPVIMAASVEDVDGSWAFYRVEFNLESNGTYARGSIVYNITFNLQSQGYASYNVTYAHAESYDTNAPDIANATPESIAYEFLYMVPHWLNPEYLAGISDNGLLENTTDQGYFRMKFDPDTGVLENALIRLNMENVSGTIKITLIDSQVISGLEQTSTSTTSPTTKTSTETTATTRTSKTTSQPPQPTTKTTSHIGGNSGNEPDHDHHPMITRTLLPGGLGGLLWYIVAAIIVIAVGAVVAIMWARRRKKPASYGAPLPPPPPPPPPQ